MIEEIKKELLKLESELHIKIIYAIESGSRAWGFESKDSDWDVRFIYIHHPDWYLSIDDKKDSYNKILPNDIDLSGWELRKALKLYRKSNPPLLEWLNSPIKYQERYSTFNSLRDIYKEYFNPKACLYHYLSMGKGNYKDFLLGDYVKGKKYFYVLRPILACQWIEKTNEMAPMEFQVLVDELITDPHLKKEIDTLLIKKINGDELDEVKRVDIINEYLDTTIKYYEHYLKEFDIRIQPDTEKLNQVFRTTLTEAW